MSNENNNQLEPPVRTDRNQSELVRCNMKRVFVLHNYQTCLMDHIFVC